MDSKKFTTQSSQETSQLGQGLGKKIKQPTIICLYGELGSGKTTFVQGLARGLGIKKRIISPTFTFIRNYKLRTKPPVARFDSARRASLAFGGDLELRTSRIFTFYHIDLYRIKNLDDIKTIGIDEILKEKGAIIAIEWAEKIKNILPKEKIDIYFKHLKENQREVKEVF